MAIEEKTLSHKNERTISEKSSIIIEKFEKHVAQLAATNKQLFLQNNVLHKRGEELRIAKEALTVQTVEQEMRAKELVSSNNQLKLQTNLKEMLAEELRSVNSFVVKPLDYNDFTKAVSDLVCIGFLQINSHIKLSQPYE